MKKFFLILFGTCAYLAMDAQTSIFVLRTDSIIDAFLTSEVDSITYDYFTADSILSPVAQYQVIWSKDSVHRIPISKIDTVLVEKQSITYNKDVFTFTSEHDPYFVSTNSLSFVMLLTTPKALRPKVGNIVVSDYTCTSFTSGILAFVDSISLQQDGYHYFCSKATFDDVFDNVMMMGETSASSVDTLAAPRRVNVTIPAQLWNLHYDESIPYSGTTTGIDITDNATLKFVLIKTENIPLTVQLSVTHSFNASLDFNANSGSEQSGDISLGSYKGPRIPVPSVPIIWFTPTFNLSIGASIVGSADIQISSHFQHTDVMSIYYNEITGWKPSYKPSTTAGIDDLSLNMTGSIEIDLLPDFFVSICDTKNGLGVGTTIGLKGEASFSFDGIEYLSNGSYDAIKDSKFILSSPQSVDAFASIDLFFMKPQEFSFPIADKEVKLKEFFLVPTFSTPTASISSTKTSVKMTTQASRELVIPVKVGLGLYDMDDTELESYFVKYDNNPQTVSYQFKDLSPNGTYICYPMVEFCGNVFRASPSKPLSLDFLCLDDPDENAVFFYNSRKWGSIHCFLWNGNDICIEWPGGTATSLGGGYYKYVIPKGFSPNNIIWNDGGTTATMSYQTNDLNFVNRALYVLSAPAPNPNYSQWGGWPTLPLCSTTAVYKVCDK